jgi:hypothetical protein
MSTQGYRPAPASADEADASFPSGLKPEVP